MDAHTQALIQSVKDSYTDGDLSQWQHEALINTLKHHEATLKSLSAANSTILNQQIIIDKHKSNNTSGYSGKVIGKLNFNPKTGENTFTSLKPNLARK